MIKNSLQKRIKIYLAFITLCMLQVQSIYFYLEKGVVKCFKDELIKNYVSVKFDLWNLIYVDIRNDY